MHSVVQTPGTRGVLSASSSRPPSTGARSHPRARRGSGETSRTPSRAAPPSPLASSSADPGSTALFPGAIVSIHEPVETTAFSAGKPLHGNFNGSTNFCHFRHSAGLSLSPNPGWASIAGRRGEPSAEAIRACWVREQQQWADHRGGAHGGEASDTTMPGRASAKQAPRTCQEADQCGLGQGYFEVL